MFTGIVQGVAQVRAVADRPGLRSLSLQMPGGFTHGLEVGASVAVDGLCLTVTAVDPAKETASFDVMQQSLRLSTLGGLVAGSSVNVERAAREGAEIGGHPLSGHVDFVARLAEVREPQNNRVLRIEVPAGWMRYVFAKGYIAVNGASLTVAEAQRGADDAGWFEVWLIPETLRLTTFAHKRAGDGLHVELDRSTQVIVDTVRQTLAQGSLLPALEHQRLPALGHQRLAAFEHQRQAENLLHQWARAVDEDRSEEACALLHEQGAYTVQPRPGSASQAAQPLVDLRSAAQLRDWVQALRAGSPGAPHRWRHLLSGIEVVGEHEGVLEVHSSFALVRTAAVAPGSHLDATEIFAVGQCRDRIALAGSGQPSFLERRFLLDARTLPGPLTVLL